METIFVIDGISANGLHRLRICQVVGYVCQARQTDSKIQSDLTHLDIFIAKFRIGLEIIILFTYNVFLDLSFILLRRTCIFVIVLIVAICVGLILCSQGICHA